MLGREIDRWLVLVGIVSGFGLIVVVVMMKVMMMMMYEGLSFLAKMNGWIDR